MKALIEIRSPGAPTIRRELGAETWIVGKKPRAGVAGIAVPTARDMSDEHLIVSFVRDRFHVALAAGARLEPTLKGKPFRQSEVTFGDEVKLGTTSLRFTGEAKRNAPSPIVIGGALLTLGVIGWALLDDPTEVNLGANVPQAPDLFDPAPPCQYSGVAAQGRAQETEQAAMAHAERYNFDPHEGVSAVLSYRIANACFRNAGDHAGVSRTAAAAKLWQDKVEGRYQGHQLRLRVAIDRGRNDHAVRELKSLKKLLRGKSGPYVSWLDLAQRQLQG
jgi:hypothetical protein